MKRTQQGIIKDYFKSQKERTTVELTRESTTPKDTSKEADIADVENVFAEATNIAEKPNQPSPTFFFPQTTFGKQQRSFQSQWFSEYKWLDYDKVRDCVTYLVCKKNSEKLKAEKIKDSFLSTGFSNSKKTLDSFKDHQKSKHHVAALSLEFVVPKCGTVREMTDENLKTKIAENRKSLLKIIETVQFLGRQGLALRGKENDESSNFWQLLKLRTNDFLKMKQWVE